MRMLMDNDKFLLKVCPIQVGGDTLIGLSLCTLHKLSTN